MGHATIRQGAIALMLALTCFTGCAPEEESTGVGVRPRASTAPKGTPTPSSQKQADTVSGGISTAGGMSTPTPDIPPPTLEPWTPAPPPSVPTIIVETPGATPPGGTEGPSTGGGEQLPTIP